MNKLLISAALAPLILLAPAPADAATTTLKATVGPEMTITLTKGGKSVHKLRHGDYVIKVADKSNMHNFHLEGPGVNKKTSVPKTGNVTWKVTLKKGQYRFVCDAHTASMKGSFKVS